MEPTVDLAEGTESRFAIVLAVIDPDDRGIEFKPRNGNEIDPVFLNIVEAFASIPDKSVYPGHADM
jgi:hypothetical protein